MDYIDMMLMYRDCLALVCEGLIRLSYRSAEVKRILQYIPKDIRDHVIYSEDYGGYDPKLIAQISELSEIIPREWNAEEWNSCR